MLELPDNSPQVWHRFFKENRSIVHRYFVKKIKKAISENLDKVELFKFKNGHTTIAKKQDYLFMLNESMKVFVHDEKYEWANEAKKVIDLYHINQLLKEVSSI
jgi:hypothetical protein